MPHIALPDLPGIIAPLAAYPHTAAPLGELTQVLLRGPSPLTEAERELIAARVSAGNECVFCANSHAAAARALLGSSEADLVSSVASDPANAPIGEKLRALLVIADKVRQDGRLVTSADVEHARSAGADDRAIHDTILIAAAFCMFNRYVDGLATIAPDDPAVYQQIGERLATAGYNTAGQLQAQPA
jgi:uncharacterized peroxidase-related enzyme